jgi:hypothetical protein
LADGLLSPQRAGLLGTAPASAAQGAGPLAPAQHPLSDYQQFLEQLKQAQQGRGVYQIHDASAAMPPAERLQIALQGFGMLPLPWPLPDVPGFAGDMMMHYREPETRDWLGYGGTFAGLAPFLPSGLGMVRRAASRAGEVRSAIGALNRGRQRLRLSPKAGDLYARTAPDLQAQPWRARVKRPDEIRRIAGGETPGQYIGAPRGIDTPEKLETLAQEYADRVEYALENGAYPGYFYRDAGDVMHVVSGGDPRTMEKMYGSSAVVSSGNRVVNERQMSGRALEQWDMGLGRPGTDPIYAGQYRGQDRTMENMFAGIDEGRPATDFVQGQKIEEYGAAASGKLDALGANDRWEMYSVFGGNPDSLASPTTQQNEFLHTLRQRAADIMEDRHGIRLRPKEAQELNWSVAKAMGENKTVEDVVRSETWSGALPRQTTLQTWETYPGPGAVRAGHMTAAAAKDKGRIHTQMRTALVDDNGRDALMDALGSSQQLPVVDGPGVYEGVVSPGVTSRGIGSGARGEVSPVTHARVRAQETARGYLLGQDAAAATMLQKGSPVSAVQVRAPLTPEKAKQIERRLSKVYGKGKVGLINTGEGFAIINYGGAENFSRQYTRYLDEDMKKLFGADVMVDKQRMVKGPDGGVFYADIPWEGGGNSPATTFLLEALDNPQVPAMAQLADSPKMRAVVGRVADAYDRLSGMLPRQQLVTVLRAWEARGLDAVRELVKKGAAPAIVIGVLGGMEESPPAAGDT